VKKEIKNMRDQIVTKIRKDIEINLEKENINLQAAILHLDRLLQNLDRLLENIIGLKLDNTWENNIKSESFLGMEHLEGLLKLKEIIKPML
jgi:hypothetical protein